MTNPTDSPQQPFIYDDAIDLRPYILDIFHFWKLLIGLPLLVGVLAAIYFLFIESKSYEATALVAVTEANFSVEADGNGEFRVTATDDLTSASDAYPEIALSDTLIESLYQDPDLLAVWPADIDSFQKLRRRLNAGVDADPSLIHLTAAFGDSDLPNLVVNRWAELFISTLYEVYGVNSSQSLVILESRLSESLEDKIQAENELSQFQGGNRVSLLRSQLEAYQNTQSKLVNDIQELSRIDTDLASFAAQLKTDPNRRFSSTTLFLFEIRVYGLRSSDTLQLDAFPATDDTHLSAEEALDLIDGLVLYSQAKKEILELKLDELEPLILSIQEQLTIATTEIQNLQDRVSLANDTYTALAAKAEEERITADIFAGQIRLASSATGSTEVGSGGLMTTVLLSIVTGILLIVGIAFRRWWFDLFSDDTG